MLGFKKMKIMFGLALAGMILSGCIANSNLWVHWQAGDSQPIIGALKNQPSLTGSQFFLLCDAYIKVRNYNEISCANDLSKLSDREIVYLLANRVKAYLEIGKFDLAENDANEAISRAENDILGDLGLTAKTSKGLFLAVTGSHSEAIELANELEKSFGSIFSLLDFDNFFDLERGFSLAQIHYTLGNYEKVIGLSGNVTDMNNNRLRKTFIQGGNTRNTSRFAYLLASSYYRTGNLIKAEQVLDLALDEIQSKGFGRYLWTTQQLMAKVKLSKQDTTSAISYYRESINSLESLRGTLSSEYEKIAFAADKQVVYADLVKLLIQQGKHAKAFEYVERGKARALVDMLAQRKDFGSTTSAALLTELEELEHQSLFLASVNDKRSTTRKITTGDIQNQLMHSSPELASLVTVNTITTKDIQNNLNKDEVALEYYGAGDDLYAFVLTRVSIKAVKLDGTGLSKDVASLRQEIQNYPSNSYKSSTKAMYNRIIKPVTSLLKGSKLTIIPHGPLHYLPFAALNDGKSYMVDKFDMRFLPSASVMNFLNKKTKPTQGLLAFGNPDLNDPELDLPGAEEETKVINSGWKGSKVLLRKHASEANFKKFAPSFKYLHLASHGEFNQDKPLQSRMLLAAGDGEDGNLTVDELYTLRLNADLVTLSACETGLGDVANGDDVIGLTRGFLYAGAKSIVASLWPVSDEATAFLMKHFYRNLKIMKKDKALRQALLSTKSKYPHPIFWSAFQMTGAN